MKRLATVFFGCALTIPAWAQESPQVEKSFMDDPLNHPMLPYYAIFALIVIVSLLIITIGVYAIRILNLLTEQVKKEKAEKLGVAYVPSPGWWERFSQKMNASVPVEQEKNIELDHSYDGIRELDNHLPPWWKWLFYGTIGWAAVYIVIFHFSGTLPLSLEEYQNEVAQAEEQSLKLRAANPASAIDENNLQYMADAVIIERGKAVFNANPCASCHRGDGGGNTIGPNLTDEYWIHGGDVKNIFNTIKNGAVDKGMPAWGKAMSPQDVRDLTFYILSLQGTNPPDGKAPQGEVFKQTISTQSDTTRAQASL
jgi:cytochrome c oxidase cbb3-type subunit III